MFYLSWTPTRSVRGIARLSNTARTAMTDDEPVGDVYMGSSAESALVVACPRCGSPAGHPCRTLPRPGVPSVPAAPHVARQRAHEHFHSGWLDAIEGVIENPYDSDYLPVDSHLASYLNGYRHAQTHTPTRKGLR